MDMSCNRQLRTIKISLLGLGNLRTVDPSTLR